MNISQFRWTILTVSFFVLLFGAYAGLYFGYFIPTFSCCYVRARAGTCFMLTLQGSLGDFTLDSMRLLGERFIYFSILVMILGKAWCGWICPLGFFQDVLDWIRIKLNIGYVRFSRKVKKRLTWVKWTFFSIAMIIPLWVAFPLFCRGAALNLNLPYCQLCPGKYILPLLVGNPDRIALNFNSVANVIMSTLGLLFSGMTVIGALIKRRFFCTFCPLGLMMSWYRKISFLKLEKNDEQCTRCQICYNICPVEIEEVYKSRGKKNVTFEDCTLCLKCVENCPEENALQAVYLGKTIYRSSARNFFERRTQKTNHTGGGRSPHLTVEAEGKK